MDANNTKPAPPASDRNTATEEEPLFDDAALLMIAKIRTERRQRNNQAPKFWQRMGLKLAAFFR